MSGWKGNLVRSRAGHDKGKTFFVVKEEDQKVILADGKVRTLQHLKSKNKRHLQRICFDNYQKQTYNDECWLLLMKQWKELSRQHETNELSNEKISNLITLYQNRKTNPYIGGKRDVES